MAFTNLTNAFNTIELLPDTPNRTSGYTAQQMKEFFDANAKIIKTYINDTLIEELENNGSLTGYSGAKNIGVSDRTEFYPDPQHKNTNIEDVLLYFRELIRSAVAGELGDNDVKTNMLNHAVGSEAVDTGAIRTGAVTTEKLAGSITADKISSVNASAITGTIDVASKIADESIIYTKLAGGILASQLAGNIPASKLAGEIPAEKITSITAGQITGQIVNSQITDGTIANGKLAGGITSDKIASCATSSLTGTISNSQLAGGITADKISSCNTSALSGSISNSQLAGGITADKISTVSPSSFNAVVPVSKGGTGAADAGAARSNLGVTPANIGAVPSGYLNIGGTNYALRYGAYDSGANGYITFSTI